MVLTGGDARLDTAVGLLEKGAAKRLLITGVHPSITKPEIRQLAHGGHEIRLLRRSRFRRRGHAREMPPKRPNGCGRITFNSLILVTANYHMPRSLSEFAAAMPNVDTRFPIRWSRKASNFARWWRDPRAVRLLHAEYAKYLASLVLDRFISRAPDRRNA